MHSTHDQQLLKTAKTTSMTTRDRYTILYRIMRCRKQRFLPLASTPLINRVERSYQDRGLKFTGWRNRLRYIRWREMWLSTGVFHDDVGPIPF